MHKIRLKRTQILNKYTAHFAFRFAVFITFLSLYLFRRELLSDIINFTLWQKVTPLHLVWGCFMVIMISHLFPSREHISMALKKISGKHFPKHTSMETLTPEQRLEMLEFTQKANVKAWVVMLVWLLFNCAIGILYLLGVLQDIDLLMLTVFYFLSDYICILFFCPFQTIIMKNKCCVNCRIFDWGHFMMFTPMMFIKSFFSWSLFATALVVLIKWEIVYANHPERFWPETNTHLKCSNCKDQLCHYKKLLRKPKQS